MEENGSSSAYAKIVDNLVERIIEADLSERDFQQDFQEYNYYVGLLKKVEKSMGDPSLPISSVFPKRRKPLGTIGEEKISEPKRKKIKIETDDESTQPIEK